MALFSIADLESEVGSWDGNAESRFAELVSDEDPAYKDLQQIITGYLKPRIARHDLVLDVGSGLGFMAEALRRAGYSVTATDPSRRSVEMARAHFPQLSAAMHDKSLQDFAESSELGSFQVVVANMVLHSVPDLFDFLQSAKKVLAPTGFILATVPHPETYIQGRGDVHTDHLDLTASQKIEHVPFRIKNHPPHPHYVTYYHRPFRDYASIAEAAGLRISDFYAPERVGTGRPGDIAVIIFSHT